MKNFNQLSKRDLHQRIAEDMGNSSSEGTAAVFFDKSGNIYSNLDKTEIQKLWDQSFSGDNSDSQIGQTSSARTLEPTS